MESDLIWRELSGRNQYLWSGKTFDRNQHRGDESFQEFVLFHCRTKLHRTIGKIT